MKILFVADALEDFKIHKDSTFAMMRELQKRGHQIVACEPSQMSWRKGEKVSALMRFIQLLPNDQQKQNHWFDEVKQNRANLCDFDVVLMRKDPPFDSEYFYATHLLEQAQREGALVLNNPSALREHPEKLAIMEFPDWIGATLISRNEAEIRAFHAQHGDIILKPLDGMGGTGIFRVREDGLNLGSIIEMLSQNGSTTLMVQRFLPEITQGDKRILIIAGKAVPFCLARIPQGSEVRGNLAAGGKGVAQPLSKRDWEIANHIGAILVKRGLLLIGLDVIGDYVTEINVTSPTCFQEIFDQTGCDVASLFVDALESWKK